MRPSGIFFVYSIIKGLTEPLQQPHSRGRVMKSSCAAKLATIALLACVPILGCSSERQSPTGSQDNSQGMQPSPTQVNSQPSSGSTPYDLNNPQEMQSSPTEAVIPRSVHENCISLMQQKEGAEFLVQSWKQQISSPSPYSQPTQADKINAEYNLKEVQKSLDEVNAQLQQCPPNYR
ncbi:MAG: hypothetical protein ACK47N_22925 [Microcystis sp.]|jgi:hypothetical protein|uniref:hypothetical protein n=1 Tax=Microcystis TaxID=1125 RepID=UPI000E3B0318|nr:MULTISPECIES: hypothetical protein [Microcystis]MBD2290043.1 hypothetical protein [Microcystis wesenbergii FACHB-1317]NCR73611.1 hypothetical protein [Microcystis aeruginosa LG13-12]REJ56339.1 MAG: hypothetical protein DWQ58_06885 [Microcystis aeruginosa TA09]UZO78112.1 hypothetical protein M8120_09655 [Microcystis aeruginosa str. Chao 1910]